MILCLSGLPTFVKAQGNANHEVTRELSRHVLGYDRVSMCCG